MKSTALAMAIFCSIFSAHAATVVKGEEARDLFQNIHAYEYSSAAITAGIEYHLTVRHDENISCEKEETIFGTQSETEYTCTIK
jgi:hypothetical protein